VSTRPHGTTGRTGPIPDAVLRRLDLSVSRRLQGFLPGDQPTPQTGAGTELAQVRAYRPGDDVRQLDWNATARTGEPHVRVHVAERSVTTWLLTDLSPSMAFGTADRLKVDVAEGVASAVGRLATRRGNRLGVMTFGGPTPRVLPPRQGRAGLHGAIEAARQFAAPELHPDATVGVGEERGRRTGDGERSDLAEALRKVGALARSRSLIVVVGDFRGPRDWVSPLRALGARHGVLALEVVDPREQELPDVGELVLADPETGRQLRVDTRSAKLRERFAQEAAAEREELRRELRRSGADHAVLSTEGDWFRSLARFLATGGAGGRPRR
jgi:uncharacterized protein (DUF58 family)